MGGWWGAVSSGFGSGFCSGLNGWVVGGGSGSAADFVADLADGWLVGAAVRQRIW